MLFRSGKFRYEQTRREKEAKKKQRVIEIKEVRLSPNIDNNDLNTKANMEPRKRGCSPLLTPKKWATPEKTEDSRLFGVKIF